MSDKEIIKAAITKALDNGWKTEIISKHYEEDELITSVDFAVRNIKKHMDLLVGTFLHNPLMLLGHSFAKALWGDELLFCGKPLSELTKDPNNQVFKTSHLSMKAWRYHIQQMAISEDRFQYLKKFL